MYVITFPAPFLQKENLEVWTKFSFFIVPARLYLTALDKNLLLICTPSRNSINDRKEEQTTCSTRQKPRCLMPPRLQNFFVPLVTFLFLVPFIVTILVILGIPLLVCCLFLPLSPCCCVDNLCYINHHDSAIIDVVI